jgi:hypothetical protein
VLVKLVRPADWATNFTFTHTILHEGYWHLYLSNCEVGSSLSLEVDVIEFNLNAADGSPMYLSAGERFLPAMLAVVAFLFLAEAAAWLGVLLAARKRGRRHGQQHVRLIHWLMLACVLVKSLSLAVESEKAHALKSHGVHDSWFGVGYAIGVVKALLLFAVVVLLATGYSYLTPFLKERDKVLLVVVLVVQTLANIGAAVLGEMAPGSPTWAPLSDLLTLVDIACWCAVLLPIAWSIRSLRAQAASDQRRGERAARNLLRLHEFRSFYLLVVAFIYLTRVLVWMLGRILPFEHAWFATMFSEGSLLALFACTGYLFRPQGANPYLPLQGQGMNEGGEGGGGGDVEFGTLRHTTKDGGAEDEEEDDGEFGLADELAETAASDARHNALDELAEEQERERAEMEQDRDEFEEHIARMEGRTTTQQSHSSAGRSPAAQAGRKQQHQQQQQHHFDEDDMDAL